MAVTPKPPSGGPYYMTPVGHAQMVAELKQLMREERPKIVEIVSWAAGNGDRSENGDYLYGKKRLREIDRRVRFLTKRLENAVVIDPATQPHKDRIYFGATVTYINAADETVQVTIVGADEADMALGRISLLSPVAKALLGASKGDEVTVITPVKTEILDILDVAYRPLA
ncbi:Transcription elongation factor greB [Granulibacter bethesdensis]|nr:Transcription elongation factor greB [Granulibacter bethesdensis]